MNSQSSQESLSSDFSEVVFCGFFRNEQKTPAEKVQIFLEAFGAPNDAVFEYRPLLLALNSSSSGEVAASFGLFEKTGELFEVSGSECSIWEFNGCWEPEATNPDILMHRIREGTLGREEYEETSFDHELLALCQKLKLEDSVKDIAAKKPKPSQKKI